MLNGATEGGMGNSSENPPYQGGRRGVSLGFPVSCSPQDLPLHPLRRGNHFHLLLVPPESGMKGSCENSRNPCPDCQGRADRPIASTAP